MTRTAYSDELSPGARRRLRARVSREILPGERSLHGCGRSMIDYAAGVVAVVSAPSAGSSEHGVSFSGVRRCGSVWLCPECSAAVSERRALDLETAAAAWARKGNTCVLLTLTFSHTRREALQDLHDACKGAMTDLRASRCYKSAVYDFACVGVVRCQEVTWGAVNGWHPHFHCLLFVRGKPTSAEQEAFRASIFSAWSSACSGNGLAAPSPDRGVDLAVGVTVQERLAAYLAKFGTTPKVKRGVEREMAKSHTKRARPSQSGGERFHPFALLDAFAATGNPIMGQKFLEYARTFKGQRQLVWSRGLKALLAAEVGCVFEERSDAEIAEAHREAEGFIELHIRPAHWVAVCRAGMRDALAARLSVEPTRSALLDVVRAAEDRLGAEDFWRGIAEAWRADRWRDVEAAS